MHQHGRHNVIYIHRLKYENQKFPITVIIAFYLFLVMKLALYNHVSLFGLQTTSVPEKSTRKKWTHHPFWELMSKYRRREPPQTVNQLKQPESAFTLKREHKYLVASPSLLRKFCQFVSPTLGQDSRLWDNTAKSDGKTKTRWGYCSTLNHSTTTERMNGFFSQNIAEHIPLLTP